MLDMDLLRTFTTVVDTGGFTAAAGSVHRTQSAVSLQMRRLEEVVGRPLFEKAGRGVRLTLDGERLLPHARRILAAQHEALAAFGEPDANGVVRIGAPEDYATRFLPRMLPRFRLAYPCTRVELVAGKEAQLMRLLDAGELDLAIATKALGDGAGGGFVLRREPAVWIGSQQHCTHEQMPLPLALYAAPCPHRDAALEALDRMGWPYWLAYSSVSIAGIYAAVEEGLAVGVVPGSSVRASHRVLSEEDGFPALPTFAVVLHRRRDRTAPERLDRLQAHVVEAFRTSAAIVA